MKRLVIGVVLAVVLTLALAGAAFADVPPGPPDECYGQVWIAGTPPGERGPYVSDGAKTTEKPGQAWVEWKRSEGYIPGWFMTDHTVPGPHQGP